MSGWDSSFGQIKAQLAQKVLLWELVAEDVKLMRQGGRALGLCPFHEEKSPSFQVFADHYHCFGCQAHGDAIQYVRQKRGLSFLQAIHFLGEKFGVDTSELKIERSHGDFKRSADLLKAAHVFFRESLSKSETARKYWESRGFSAEFQIQEGLGYAPKGGKKLLDSLRKSGFSLNELREASLIFQKENYAHDFFSGRVMIPIYDSFGQLCAFGGRVLNSAEQPKYKNSRYDKGSVLFGSHRLGRKWRPWVLVVEGYMDALQLWQQGVSSTVALQGTSLTPSHTLYLSSITGELILLLDGDQAGEKGSLRVLELILPYPNLKVSRVSLPPGADPDSFIRTEGKQGLEKILEHREDIWDWALERFASQGQGIHQGHGLIENFLPWVRQIQDPIKRAFVAQKISYQTGIPLSLMGLEETSKNKPAAFSRPQDQEKTFSWEEACPLKGFTLAFFGHLFYGTPQDSCWDRVEDFLEKKHPFHPHWLELAQSWLTLLSLGKNPAEAELCPLGIFVKSHLEEEAFRNIPRKEAFETLLHIWTKHENALTLKKLKNELVSTKDANLQKEIWDQIKTLQAFV